MLVESLIFMATLFALAYLASFLGWRIGKPKHIKSRRS